MDGKKKAAGSSLVDDLFGPKDGSASQSSAGYFSTVFPNPPAVNIFIIASSKFCTSIVFLQACSSSIFHLIWTALYFSLD
jgi:hypothetical protein